MIFQIFIKRFKKRNVIKRKRTTLPLVKKGVIVKDLENGISIYDLSKKYDVRLSTITYIKWKKKKDRDIFMETCDQYKKILKLL